MACLLGSLWFFQPCWSVHGQTHLLFPRLASTFHRRWSAKQIYNNHLRPFLTRHQARLVGLVNEVYEQMVHCFFLQNSNTLETHNICRSRSLDHTKERFVLCDQWLSESWDQSMKLHHQANDKDKSQTLALNQNLNPIMKTNWTTNVVTDLQLLHACVKRL